MATKRRLSGSIALSKLKHVIMTKNGKKDKKGKKTKVKGIFIPLDVNYLTEKDGSVYLNISVLVREDEDKYGQHGFIGQNADTETYKKLKKKGGKKFEAIQKLPILGNIKDFSANSGSSNDNSGSAGNEVDENDDLPF